MVKPSIICLTPVKNEVEILDRFLQCTSLWADYIIILDQLSDDGSRNIAKKYSKVILLDNPSLEYDESTRQKILLDEARKISGPRLILALDADEILSANFLRSKEWDYILNQPKGTVLSFQRIELLPGMRKYRSLKYHFPIGYMDDGCEHEGSKIHSTRIPFPKNANEIKLYNTKILHYKNTNWKQMESKHRWYQAWEKVNNPNRSSINIYRNYNGMYDIPSSEIKNIRTEWITDYESKGIDMTSPINNTILRWDTEVLKLFEEHGLKKFTKQAIWDVNWSEIYKKNNPGSSHVTFNDPRSFIDKYIQKWLRKTQWKSNNLSIRIIEAILKVFGW